MSAQVAIACLVTLRPNEVQTFDQTLQRLEILQAVNVFRAYLAASCCHGSRYGNFELRAQLRPPSLDSLGSLAQISCRTLRTHTPSLAGEGHDKTLAAARAESACESKAEDAALEIAAELVLDVSRHGPLRLVTPLEPALKMLRRDLVERRLVGASTLVAVCGTASPRGAAGSSGRGPAGRSFVTGASTPYGGPQPRR
jgi:hypothetical protein